MLLKSSFALRLAIIISLALGGGHVLAQDSTGDARRLTVQQTAVVNAAPAAPTIKLDAWFDRADGLYVPGEAVTLHLRSDTDAYITVLNVDASGATTVLYPNNFARENRLAAGSTVVIPAAGADYKFAVSPPYGGNVLKVIASSTSTPLFQPAALRNHLARRYVPNSRQVHPHPAQRSAASRP